MGNCVLNSNSILTACKNGDIKIVKYLFEKGAPIRENEINEASYNGHLEIVKYLFEKGAPIYTWAISSASMRGHLEIVKYLFEKGAPIDKRAIALASDNGHIEIVKYLFEKGAPVDAAAIRYASYSGHLKTVKYLFEKGAPIGAGAINEASYHGYTEIVKYLRRVKGFPRHVGSGQLGPESSRLNQAGCRDVVGMAVLPIRCEQYPRPGQSKDRCQLATRSKCMFQSPIGETKVVSPVQLKCRGCRRRFPGTNLWRAMRSWFSIRQIQNADVKPLTMGCDQRAADADLGIVGVRRDGQDVQRAFQRLHKNSSRHV